MTSKRATFKEELISTEVIPGDDDSDRFSIGARRQDPFDGNEMELKRRSVLAYKQGATARQVDAGEFLTNEQVLQALQLKVYKTVEVTRRYRRVLWYSLFVASYLIVLYLQASAYKSGEVVSTLRNALMVDGQLSMVFKDENEVLAYLGTKVLLPTWKDPVCGDGNCEYPWEFPAYGRFGCLADCGAESNTTKIAVNIQADFTGNPSISARVLMSSVRWNLCSNDPDRTARGEADLCWYDTDQTFEDVKVNRIESMEVVDGVWYLVIKGDYTGVVTGTVFDLTEEAAPEVIEVEPKWEKCKLPTTTTETVPAGATATTTALRKLLTAYKEERSAGNTDPQLLRKLRIQYFPDLKMPEAPITSEMALDSRQQRRLAELRSLTYPDRHPEPGD